MGAVKSRQGESKEVHEVGSKRPSLGCNGVHVVWWIGLIFRLMYMAEGLGVHRRHAISLEIKKGACEATALPLLALPGAGGVAQPSRPGLRAPRPKAKIPRDGNSCDGNSCASRYWLYCWGMDLERAD
jgi:hypothetical protein